MMKFLRAAILPLVLISFAVPVFAQGLAPITLSVRRTGLASGWPANTNYTLSSGTASFVDSTIFSSSSLTTAQVQDTTAWITSPVYTSDFENVRCALVTSASATADSAYACLLMVAGSNRLGTTISFDTLFVTVQGTADNGSTVIAAPAIAIREPSSGNFAQRWFTVLTPAPVAGAGSLTNANVFLMPEVRFILSLGSDNGQYVAKMFYFRKK